MPLRTPSQYQRRIAAGLTRRPWSQGQDSDRAKRARAIRGHRRWRDTRRRVLAHHPLCCDPLKLHGHTPPAAAHVHHIQPVIDRPDLAHDWSNLAPLCEACHYEIERMARRGVGTGPMFAGLDAGAARAPLGGVAAADGAGGGRGSGTSR
jgi:hypothetical protein